MQSNQRRIWLVKEDSLLESYEDYQRQCSTAGILPTLHIDIHYLSIMISVQITELTLLSSNEDYLKNPVHDSTVRRARSCAQMDFLLSASIRARWI